ncbi:MAG TPA: alpha/beta hydrolase [Gaiellaceae bacterium]|jgi:pimeloyl-ACP methyl ester carboxylesterase
MRRWLRRIGVAIAALVLAVTVASLIYNAATSGRDRPATDLYPGPYVSVDGTTLAYRQWGSHGTPIVLIGGFLEPAWVWHLAAPKLAQHHRVYAVDLPPFGYSQRRGPYTLARWTQLVQGFALRLHLVHPVIVGHSLGAAVAVDIATKDPHAVAGIVLLDGDALPVGGGVSLVSHLLLPPWFTSAYRLATASNWLFSRVLRNAWGVSSPPFTDAFLDDWQRPFRVSGTAAALVSLLGNGIQGVSTKVLAAVRVRSLVVWGSRDNVDSVSAGRSTAALLRAPFTEIPNAGHLSMLVRPNAVAAAIARFAR